MAGLSLGCAAEEASPWPAGASPPFELEVLKAQRQLRVLSAGSVIAQYPIGLGFQPRGDKVRQGDGATPEGEYRVCIKNPQSRYYLSLGLTYPNARDAARGRAAGLLSPAEEQSILQALERGHCPPWNTPLGGEIFLHGRGSATDWTLGCIALDDPHMKVLFHNIDVGARVTIRP